MHLVKFKIIRNKWAKQILMSMNQKMCGNGDCSDMEDADDVNILDTLFLLNKKYCFNWK